MTRLSRNSPCICGSGKRFKNCCGQIDAPLWHSEANGRIPGSLVNSQYSYLVEDEPVCQLDGKALPPGILVQQLEDDYHWRDIARALINTSEAERAKVSNKHQDSRESTLRVTSVVSQGDNAAAIVELVRKLYSEFVEPFYGVRLRWFEEPQVLRYEPGGYYRPHVDSDNINPDTLRWERSNDRHLSLLLYLNDDFEGGALAFANFGYKLHPKAGMMVAFPSDLRYLHGAMPVVKGVRHAIVSWSCVEGGEVVFDIPPQGAVLMHQ